MSYYVVLVLLALVMPAVAFMPIALSARSRNAAALVNSGRANNVNAVRSMSPARPHRAAVQMNMNGQVTYKFGGNNCGKCVAPETRGHAHELATTTYANAPVRSGLARKKKGGCCPCCPEGCSCCSSGCACPDGCRC